MGIQAFVPSGGGGTPGFDYIASINMTTFNRTWSQSGAAGNYVVTSNNNNSGYVYFTNGSSTTGGPLGKVVVLSHSFTTINIIAPTGDFISLYKASVKSTTTFANPFAAFSSFPSIIGSSGNFVLPTSALPLVDAIVVGGGGGGGGHHSGGGGGGGAVISLTGYQAVGTTGVTIGGGAGGSQDYGYKGGTTYFGNVFALGGTGGSGHYQPTDLGGNGGGANGHSGRPPRSGVLAASANGLGTQVGTSTVFAGNLGGNAGGSHAGGGGGGAGGIGGDGSGGNAGACGAPFVSSISGSSYKYAHGGSGGTHSPNNGHGNTFDHGHGNYGAGGYGAHNSSSNNYGGGSSGVVIVRYYIT
jgi:hypothetical protein